MNAYEAVIIITKKVSEEQLEEVKNKISELISSNGEVVSVDDWGSKKLAYEINKEEEGYYFLYTFNTKPEFISEFERILRIETNVLKHMVIKKEDNK